MSDPSFFGYGSLVNLATHNYENSRLAQITGWRRIWRSTTHRDFAILSVQPTEGGVLDGIIADVPNADWAALDAREFAYDRQVQSDGTAIYQVTDHIIAPASGPYPILRSYLDVVIQGYVREFGPTGATHFAETTDNWGPIYDDRAAPRYPRHQSLNDEENAIVDSILATVMK